MLEVLLRFCMTQKEGICSRHLTLIDIYVLHVAVNELFINPFWVPMDCPSFELRLCFGLGALFGKTEIYSSPSKMQILSRASTVSFFSLSPLQRVGEQRRPAPIDGIQNSLMVLKRLEMKNVSQSQCLSQQYWLKIYFFLNAENER